jgi:hypothetical protein
MEETWVAAEMRRRRLRAFNPDAGDPKKRKYKIVDPRDQ